MQVEHIESEDGLARVKIGGAIYYRLVDLARDYNTKYKSKTVAQMLSRMFRESRPDEFFYLEISPKRGRGYYVSEESVDAFVFFAQKHAAEALARATTEAVKKITATSEKPAKKKKAKRSRAPVLPEEVIKFTKRQINGTEVNHFFDNGTLWIKLADIANVLRPNTKYYALIASMSRKIGIDLRSVRYPGVGKSGSYFGKFDDWDAFIRVLSVKPDDLKVVALFKFLSNLKEPERKEQVEIPEEIRSQLSALDSIVKSIRKYFPGSV